MREMIYFWCELEVAVSNTIDWEYSSNLALMSISSYVEYKIGNIDTVSWKFSENSGKM